MENEDLAEICEKCGLSQNLGCTVHNVPANCVERVTFPYMNIGESMHLECYIAHVIESILKKEGKL